jgi:hypothetical protein
MRIYKVYDPDNGEWPVEFTKTAGDAGKCIKRVSDQSARTSIQVDLCEVKANVDNFVDAFNGRWMSVPMQVLRSWRGTPRGGMRELGEEPEESDEPAEKFTPAGTDPAAFWASLTEKK